MQFENATPANAAFLNTVFGEDTLLGCVIARSTFRIEGEEAIPTPDDEWPIGGEPMETEFGTFPSDVPFLTGGIDVFVGGRVHAPRGGPVESLRLEIAVGEAFRRAILVTGDRRWERVGGGLRASAPKPFEQMLLAYENAFGGRLAFPEGKVPYGANPEGKGWYLTEEQAEGQPLPNLEDPEAPIARFDDHPEPVGTGVYPRDWALAATNGVDLDLDPANPRIRRMKPLLFNAAHPRMIIPPAEAPRPGDRIEVSHASPDGPLRFRLPDVPLHLHVQLEERHHLFPAHVDQIGVIAEERRGFLSQRVVFRYRMRRRERRFATLHPGPIPEAVPPDYTRQLGN